MSTSRTPQYGNYMVEVFKWLLANPNSTRYQIQSFINSYSQSLAAPPTKIPEAYGVIYRIRTVLGPDVIVCVGRRGATYHVATSRSDGMTWIHDRKKNIRNQVQRTHKAVEDIETKYGSDKDLKLVKASLESALLILDASGTI